MGSSSLRDVLQSTIGDAYVLERELTGGGMSRVFLAEERALGRRVVVKLLRPESAELVSAERFRREIQVAARLQHPHVVPLLAAGQAGGVPYFTMPFVAGESLRARLGRGDALPVATVAAVLRDVARALAYAHEQGIVHRDIKPDNVLLSGELAMVTDFGVAKALGVAAQHQGDTLTGIGMALGTPAYMAPEQALGDSAADHRADLYALGCVGYEMLAGAPPFSGRSPQAVVAAHVSEAPAPLAARAPHTPKALAALVMRCLAKDPADRPQSAAEIVHALDAILAETSGHVTRAGTRAARARRRYLGLAAAVVVAAAIAAVAVQAARSGSTMPGSARTTAPAAAVASIAVLPLETIGGGEEAAYLGEGITEEIANALTSVPGLRVAARTSARAARDRGLDVRQIGEALDVARVLQGSVQRAGDRLRVSVRLVSAEDGTEMWADRFDRDAGDIFALQDVIAREVVERLRPDDAPPAGGMLVRAGTTDPEAHNLYLQALHQLNRRDRISLPRAVDLFERAIARDPRYARAHAQLAVTYAVLPDYLPAATAESESRALAAAARALALDSTVAEAYAVRGLVHGQRWENAAAADAHARALALDPRDPLVVFWNGIFRLRFPSRLDESTALMRRALELDPLSLVIGAAYGRALYQNGQPEAALAQYDRVAQIDSTYAPLASHRAGALLAVGRARDAVAVLAQELAATRSPVTYARLGHARLVAGDTAGARADLAEAIRRDSLEVAQVPISVLLSALGQQDEAVRRFIRGFERHDPSLDDYAQDPRLAGLRRDPRLASYFARMEAAPD